MSGQWRRDAAGGPTSLDYTPLFARMERMGLSDDEWNELFADVQVIEGAALEQIAKNESA